MVNAISAMEIAASGLSAQRTRMNVIANNIANALTTRTKDGGGAFRRQLALFSGGEPGLPGDLRNSGVAVERVVSDMSPLRTVYDPGHPDADENGYVTYPNVNLAVEMVDMVSAQRAYEANIAVAVSSKQMTQNALEIIQA